MGLYVDSAKPNNSYSGPSNKTPRQRLPPGARWPTARPNRWTPQTGRTMPQWQGNNLDPAAIKAAKEYKYNGYFGENPIGAIKNPVGGWSLAQDPNEYSGADRLSPHGRFARGAPYNRAPGEGWRDRSLSDPYHWGGQVGPADTNPETWFNQRARRG